MSAEHFTVQRLSCIIPPVKRILSLYIIREIASLFLLGIIIFTLVLLMGRLIALTDLVVSRGVPFFDVCRMVIYLIPSFLVFTIPMSLLLAVLLAFGRLSADNEIVVLKSSGMSLVQLLSPVFICASFAVVAALAVSTIGVPWGNGAFKELSLAVLKQNISSTIREKTFWDDIPGVVMYIDHFDDQNRTLRGVVIHDNRDAGRPMTIFAKDGIIAGKADNSAVQLALHNGSIHMSDSEGLYRLVNFGEYSMSVGDASGNNEISRNESDMKISELRRQLNAPETPDSRRPKLFTELHSRFTFPVASLVFAILAVPLGIQNRRSGKSGGFTISIAIILTYYVLMSVMRTFAERSVIPPILALWMPNLVFLAVGIILMRMASQEKKIPLLSFRTISAFFRKDS